MLGTRKPSSNRNRGTSFPLVVLFGVILAILTSIVFALFYERQLEARVVGQAQSLADELASTAFSSQGGGQPTLNLPRDIGGSAYQISISNNNTFIVKIMGGRLKGREYSSIVNATLLLENGNFTPGGKAYFQRAGDVVIVSASPIAAPAKNLEQPATTTPPEFYYFAKESQREAAAIAATYFHALEDANAYKWQDSNTLLVKLKNDQVFQVQGENLDKVDKVDNAWIVQRIDNFAGGFTGAMPCPSPENAWRSGWLYSPSQALAALRSRSWRRVSDNVAVVVPVDATINVAAATTNVGTFLVYRVEWENYTIYYRAIPWWHEENIPGFVFQSKPKLEAIT